MSCLSAGACCDCIPLSSEMESRQFSSFALSLAPSTTQSDTLENPREVNISQFFSNPKDLLGQGGFGYVKLATKRCGLDKGTKYAIKIMKKSALLVRKRGIECVFTELELLQTLGGSLCLCQAHYAFQDTGNLYLVRGVTCSVCIYSVCNLVGICYDLACHAMPCKGVRILLGRRHAL